MHGLTCWTLTHQWKTREFSQHCREEIIPRYLGLIPYLGSRYAMNLVRFLRSQIAPLREPLNMILTFCQTLYCLLKVSTKYHLWNLVRSENSLMSTSERAGLGPVSLLMGPLFFLLGKPMEL